MNWLSRRARAELAARLLNDSGGLWYHWRALRYRRRLWRPFVERLAPPLLALGVDPIWLGVLLALIPNAGIADALTRTSVVYVQRNSF